MGTQESRLDIVMELAADSVESGLGGVGEMLGGLTSPLGLATLGASALGGALIGAAGYATGLASSLNSASNQATAALGLTEEEAANLNQTMQNIYGGNYGASFEDIATSLVGVEQAFARVGDISEAEAQQITEDALMIRDVFGTEVSESANAAATLVEEFGLTTQEAMDFITAGYQNGLDASGDFLDTIGEYSTQFSEGGASAEQFFSLLDSGMQGGMLGTDKAADAFKEFQVRILDGSTLTAGSLEQIGIDSETFLAGLADGSMSTIEAFDIVNQKLAEVEDGSIQMQAGVGLIGTQFEDLGASAALALSSTGTSMQDLAGATDSLNVKYNDLPSAWGAIWRQVEVAIIPVGTAILDLVNTAMPSVQAGFAAAQPYLEQFATWLSVNIPAGAAAVASYWTTTLQPALATGVEFFNVNLLPVIQQAVEFIGTNLPGAMAAVSDFWTNTLSPALSGLWSFAQESLLPVLIDLGEIGFHGIRLAAIGLVQFWEESLQPALEASWKFVSEDLAPVWAWLLDIFENIAGAIAWVSDLISNMGEPPEWVLQLMGGGASTAAAATSATTVDDKGDGTVQKAQTAINGRGMGGFSIGAINISGASNYQEAYMGAVNGVRDELRSRGVRVA